ncbi:MAG: ABC transporter ATP-binding protein [Phycisphaerae bacterium]|nr:ABC transporter ATP-binding protein [Phycisphaerae bacterium]NUQ47819.1 ABC transporter ATP-binding protein [Phycisphaerae bacterium]
MSTVVRVENVAKQYRLGAEVIHALRGVSLEIAAGEFVAIMGASGSGKSTLLHLTGGLDLPDAGRVLVENADLTRMPDRERTLFRRRRIGVIFQAYNLLPNLTARENVMLPLLVDGATRKLIEERASEVIRLVQLEHRAAHRPDAMSGGEQQRVAIARALLTQPAVLLADEPTGNLDPANSRMILDLLRRLSRDMGTTILMVTHEAAAASGADRVLVLSAGLLVGEVATEGRGDAALVAARYAELAR